MIYMYVSMEMEGFKKQPLEIVGFEQTQETIILK